MSKQGVPVTGGCLCSAIRFESDEAPVQGFFCHCTMCQKAYGGLFSGDAAREKPDVLMAIIVAAACNGNAGRDEEAKRAMAQVRRIDPALRMSNLKGLFPIRRPEDFEKWSEGLCKAGLPE
jgi:hypothetical protein